MKRLTKREALRLTVELWEWLGAEYGRTKGDYAWEGQIPTNACFLCEYRSLHQPYPRPCKSCPLYKKWDGCNECDDDGSPYHIWEVAMAEQNYPATQGAADRIAELCREELARLGTGRKVTA